MVAADRPAERDEGVGPPGGALVAFRAYSVGRPIAPAEPPGLTILWSWPYPEIPFRCSPENRLTDLGAEWVPLTAPRPDATSAYPTTGWATMARGRWTLVIVSDDPTRVRQVRLSRDAVRLAVAVALLVFSALGSLAVGFFVKESERVTARRLARKNALLEAELAGIKEGMAALRAALEELSKKDAHFRLVAGLEPLDEEVLRAGIGGPGTETLESNPLWKLDTRLGEQTFTTAYDLNTMLRRAQVLAASWDAALNTLEQRYEELEATPSIAPVVGYVSSAFSRQRWHPILERPRPHEGVDIVAPKGAPIYATARGRVTFAGRNGAYGLMVEIDHGRGYVTRYAHASRTLVRRGQLVERGQKIAEVGDTGLAVAPHVHYEVLVNGRPVNPQLHILNEEVIPD